MLTGSTVLLVASAFCLVDGFEIDRGATIKACIKLKEIATEAIERGKLYTVKNVIYSNYV
jgi:hypothetical protein